jgi:FtsH-binding integral membrane protein
MAFSLLVTALAALLVIKIPPVHELIFGSILVKISIFCALIAVFARSNFAWKNCRAITAFLLCFTYAILVGLTISVGLITHQFSFFLPVSILACASWALLSLSCYCFLMKRDLEARGSFCLVGLSGMVGLMLVIFYCPSMYAQNNNLVLSVISLLGISQLVAVDSQKIKNLLAKSIIFSSPQVGPINIALMLYLDIINLTIVYYFKKRIRWDRPTHPTRVIAQPLSLSKGGMVCVLLGGILIIVALLFHFGDDLRKYIFFFGTVFLIFGVFCFVALALGNFLNYVLRPSTSVMQDSKCSLIVSQAGLSYSRCAVIQTFLLKDIIEIRANANAIMLKLEGLIADKSDDSTIVIPLDALGQTSAENFIAQLSENLPAENKLKAFNEKSSITSISWQP